jgi:N-acetylmuramoyl-L-alanine amidase
MSQRSRSWSKLVSAMAFLLTFAICICSADAKTKRSHSKSRSKARTTRVSKPPPSQGRFNTVVIDAGHGGFDRGGIRRNIIPEKGVTLDVALRLERSLRNAGFKTVMTRSDDRFVTLDRRVAIANAHPDAIFICIHFNSAWRPGARGIETFYAAPSEAPLAIRIQRNLMTTTSGDNRGVKRASFYVLRRTRTRAVLVECGFLTNSQDAALASRASYRQRLADQISRAIIDYRNSL